MLDLFKTRPLLVFALIVSNILLSAWCLSQDPVINNDGITYIALAQLITQGQWQQAVDYYSWPYYPLLLAGVSKLLSMDLELTAYMLNFFFVIVLSLGFLSIVSELSKQNGYTAESLKRHNRTILIAALVIVLFPSITKYRAFIIRDFAYISCYLWSVYFIFKYCASHDLKHLIAWLTLAILGSFFRFESIAFVLIAPYLFFLINKTNTQIKRPILMLLSSLLICACLALFWWYATAKYEATIAYAQSQGENINNLWDLFFANAFSDNNQKLSFGTFIQQGLNNIGTVAYELTRRMAVLYLIFTIVAYAKNLAFKKDALRKVWLIYIVINLTILVGFSFFNNFLVSRYTLATALTLLVLCPFAINRLYENFIEASNFRKRAFGVFILIILVGISIERLHIETDKKPLKQAGLWLAENAAPDAKIFSTHKIINYYAGRDIEDTENILHSFQSVVDAYLNKQIKSQDYIALATDFSLDSHRLMWRTFNNHFGAPIHRIDADEQNSVIIYSHHKSNLSILNLRY